LISQYCTAIQNGFQLIWKYFGQIPVITTSDENKKPLVEKVSKILTVKKLNPAADTSVIEKEIDQIVYTLYGLTAEEIAIVENS
jgi:adenine-specific DNA-methyltransferase